MTDDLADLHRLDRALDELNASEGNRPAAGPSEPVPPRDAEHGPERSRSRPEGEPTVELDTTPSADQNGVPTQELSAPVAMNGHRPRPAPPPDEPADDDDDVELAGALTATAAALRASVPASPPEAGARGREAFLASADRLAASQAGRRRRRVLVRAAALAAALLLVGIPAALARQALPGSPLYPVHQVTQDARVAFAGDPVDKAKILLDEAERMRDEAVRGGSDRDRCINVGRDDANQALDKLRGVSGAAAAAQVARANQLLHDFHDLAEGKLPGDDHSGPGRGGDDRSGPGGGGDDRGGSGSGGSGSGGGGDDGGGSSHGGSGSGSDGSGSGGGGSGSGSGSDGSGSGSGGGTSGGGGDD
jgi:uncharacterized membrane protein YgcG